MKFLIECELTADEDTEAALGEAGSFELVAEELLAAALQHSTAPEAIQEATGCEVSMAIVRPRVVALVEGGICVAARASHYVDFSVRDLDDQAEDPECGESEEVYEGLEFGVY